MKNMKLVFVLMLAVSTVFFWGCTNKKLDVQLQETACKAFLLSAPNYEWRDNADCGGGELDRRLKIDFAFDGDEGCVHLLDYRVEFYDIDNNQITSGITVNSPLQYFRTDADLTINTADGSFNFCYSYASAADSVNLNYIRIYFHTENEIGNQSNEMSLRIHRPGAPISDDNYTIEDVITVNSKDIQIRIWDDAAEDGDIVSLNLNGEWILENRMLSNAGEVIKVLINPGDNVLIMYAVNLGEQPPNTGAISVDDGFTVQEVTLNSNLTNSGAIKIKY